MLQNNFVPRSDYSKDVKGRKEKNKGSDVHQPHTARNRQNGTVRGNKQLCSSDHERKDRRGQIGPRDLTKMLKIGANLCPKLKQHLVSLFRELSNIFA